MKLLLYCTKAKPYLQVNPFDLTNSTFRLSDDSFNSLNGKIVAECDFEVEEIVTQERGDYNYDCFSSPDYFTKTLSPDELADKSCLTYEDIDNYLDFENGYAIHIKNLHIFDKPKELQECATLKRIPDDYHIGYYERFESVERAPQNMQYVYDVNSANPKEKKVLISIRPEWLCKILNGEKKIEVRRKVLKEMLK